MGSGTRPSHLERWLGLPVDVVTWASPEYRLTVNFARASDGGADASAPGLRLDAYRLGWLIALAALLSVYHLLPRGSTALVVTFAALAGARVLEITAVGLRLFLIPREQDAFAMVRAERSTAVAFVNLVAMTLAFAVLFLCSGEVEHGTTPITDGLHAAFFSFSTITTLGYSGHQATGPIAMSLVILELICGFLLLIGLIPMLINHVKLRDDERPRAER